MGGTFESGLYHLPSANYFII